MLRGAEKAGNSDGMVAGYLTPYDCDPRGRFIKRPDLDESEWPAYRVAFEAAFTSVVRR